MSRFKPWLGPLPSSYTKDDEDFIIGQLERLPYYKREEVSRLYSLAYDEAYAREPISYRKAGKARREANIRLRRYIKRYDVIFMEKTRKPPKAL